MKRALPVLALAALAACSKFEAEPVPAMSDGGTIVEAGALVPDAQVEPADAGSACVLPAGTNVQTDALHCGTCGHDCLGGECSAGVCLPRVLGPWKAAVGIAVAGDKLYVAHSAGIDRCTLDGKIETNIAPGGQVQYLAAAGDTLYFTTPSTIGSIGLITGATHVLQDSATDFLGIALSPTDVFFSRIGAAKPIQRLPLDANTAVAPKTVVAQFNGAQGLAWSAGSLYIASPIGTNSVVVADALGNLGVPIVTSNQPIAVAIDGPDVFIARQGVGPNSGDILRLRGGELQILASAQGGDVAAIAVTPKAIYWSAFADGNVKRLAR